METEKVQTILLQVEESEKRLLSLQSLAVNLQEQINALSTLVINIKDDARDLADHFTNHTKRHVTDDDIDQGDEECDRDFEDSESRPHKKDIKTDKVKRENEITPSPVKHNLSESLPERSSTKSAVKPFSQSSSERSSGKASEPDNKPRKEYGGRRYKRRRTPAGQDNRLSLIEESTQCNDVNPANRRISDDKSSKQKSPEKMDSQAESRTDDLINSLSSRDETPSRRDMTSVPLDHTREHEVRRSQPNSTAFVSPVSRQTEDSKPVPHQTVNSKPLEQPMAPEESRNVSEPNTPAHAPSEERSVRDQNEEEVLENGTHNETHTDTAEDDDDEELVDAPEVEVKEDQQLEELTLKEANKAADCRDPKSQGADTILCVDTSTSMEGCLDEVKDFMHDFLDGIEAAAVDFSLEENIAIVTFGKETRIIQNLTNDYTRARDAIDSLEVGGPSPMMTGLVLCMSAIYNRGGVVTYKDRKIRPRILLLSDGKVTDQRIFNGPDAITKQGHNKTEIWRKLMEFAERLRTHGEPRHLVCIPFGNDADMQLFRQLSNTAGGRMAQREDATRLSRNFMLETVAARLIHDGILKERCLPPEETLHQTIKTAQQGYELNKDEIEDVVIMLKIDLEHMREQGAEGGTEEGEIEGEEREMPQIGTRVRRGPHWKWGDQDSNSVGTVIAHRDRGWLSVEWDTGFKGKYRYGAEGGAKDVRVVDEPRILPEGMMAAVGCKARRGPDWEWGNQDGGEGATGIVFKIEDSGVIHIRWESGKRGNYRFGLFGKFDVEMCPSSISQVDESQGNIDEKGKIIQWQWMDQNGDWIDFPKPSSDKIENFYQKRGGKGTVIVSSKTEDVRVMVEKWIQRGISSGVESPVRREEEEKP